MKNPDSMQNPDSFQNQDSERLIKQTQNWVEHAVIGLGLCPFAKKVFIEGRVRYVVSSAKTREKLLENLEGELQFLHTTDSQKNDTSIIIFSEMFLEFLDFNDFVNSLDRFLDKLNLKEEFQFATFHPQYQFANTSSNAIENFTNRSPYPTLQILRQQSMSKVLLKFPNPDSIFKQNILTMRKLGIAGWVKLKLSSRF
jgi:hypothetical protein